MVRRGIKLDDVSAFFRLFVESCFAGEETIFIGHYAIYGRLKARKLFVTIRVDIDAVAETAGEEHIVTVFIGRGNDEGVTEWRAICSAKLLKCGNRSN